MTIALVQTAALGSTTLATSQQSSAFAANPTTGNMLVAWAWGDISGSLTSLTFSDTAGNTWTVPSNVQQVYTVGGSLWFTMAYAPVTATGASFKVKMTVSPSSKINVCAAEFSGVATVSPVSGTPVGTTSGSALSFALGNMTVSAGDLVVCGCCNNDGTTPATLTFTGGAAFNSVARQLDSGAVFTVGQALYAINPTSPTDPSWSESDTFAVWSGSQFALKAAAATTSGFKAAWIPKSVVLGAGIYNRVARWFLNDPLYWPVAAKKRAWRKRRRSPYVFG